ncbi:MAG TPA: CDP-glycerol glycerophosphotransferase family protein [Gemmatimonadales bacterium]|nr:CDP-glycerol glycerophosphotransferase family protein [Gemmatimonadales bacterium]
MAKIRLLFKIGFVYHKAAFDPVIERFLADDRYDVFFALDEERMRRWGIFNVPYRPPIVDQWVREGYRFTREQRGFDVVIAGDTIRDAAAYGRTLLCFLNHGTGIKTILYRNLAQHRGTRYQIYVEGAYREEKILESGQLGRSEIHVVGLPKLDGIFQGRYAHRDRFLSERGLDADKPTVLFAPTYKPTCLYDVKDAIFEATKDRYNLVVKLHHYSWMGKYAPHEQHRIFERRVRRYPHARLVPMEEYNIVPWMAAADTLMSEASSTVFDFLALGKTGIIYDLPGDRLKHSDGMPLLGEDNRDFLKDAFVHVSRPDDIGDAIGRALTPTGAMRAAQSAERERLFHRLDGHASDRMKASIEALLAEGGHENAPEGPGR